MARILVIDDDEIVNEMIVQLLIDEGYQAEGARDGAIGMKLFTTKTFDLIVTDIIMPEKEGIETILGIRAKNKTIPIIAISGGGKNGPDEYLSLAQIIGANYIFKKPFINGKFLEAIKICLNQ
jgi:DNA-binding response OmpR family regulator